MFSAFFASLLAGSGVVRIVTYPHPALRYESVRVTRFDETLRTQVREMFDLMYAHKGVGLAANQVALPYRLFVVNLTGEAEKPEEEAVFINVEILKKQSTSQFEEGCLSFPGLYGKVLRPKKIRVRAQDLDGEPYEFDCDDLLARVIQHENDHVRGRLFVDLFSTNEKYESSGKIREIEDEFRKAQANGEYALDDEIVRQLNELAKVHK